jgi:hypothetical protein
MGEVAAGIRLAGARFGARGKFPADNLTRLDDIARLDGPLHPSTLPPSGHGHGRSGYNTGIECYDRLERSTFHRVDDTFRGGRRVLRG